jgi:hypothetical protein
MTTIHIPGPHGLPLGVYSIAYYRVTGDGEARRQAIADTNVGVRYVESLKLAPHEMAVATCQSQPGGARLFGSAEARRSYEDAQRREAHRIERLRAEAAEAVAAVPETVVSLPDGREVSLSVDAEGFVLANVTEAELAVAASRAPRAWLDKAKAARRAVLAAGQASP